MVLMIDIIVYDNKRAKGEYEGDDDDDDDDDDQWRTEGGFRGFNPPPHPRNSEGPPKSCQTQPDCENC